MVKRIPLENDYSKKNSPSHVFRPPTKQAPWTRDAPAPWTRDAPAPWTRDAPVLSRTTSSRYRKTKYHWRHRKLVCAWRFHLSLYSVFCVTFDYHRMATGSLDRTIKLWDIKTGNLLQTLRGHLKGVWCLLFFTDTLLVSGSYDCTLRVSLAWSWRH
jgi:WD40 repeat protein